MRLILRVEESTLIIQGERRFIKETPEENYIQIERPYGTFRRTFNLPKTIDQEGIKASYKDGVLRVVLPRKQEISTQTDCRGTNNHDRIFTKAPFSKGPFSIFIS